MTAFWDIALCSLAEVDWRFRGAYSLHHQGDIGRSTHLWTHACRKRWLKWVPSAWGYSWVTCLRVHKYGGLVLQVECWAWGWRPHPVKILSSGHPRKAMARKGLSCQWRRIISETSVYFSKTTRRFFPEGYHLHTRRRVNLKSPFHLLH
jgi:hypothetical protein